MTRILLLFSFFSCNLLCSAQSAEEQAAKALQAQMQGRQYILKDFAAQDKVHYDLANGSLQSKPPSIHCFCSFAPKSVALHHDVITIEGEASVAVRDAATNKLTLTKPSFPVKLEVNLSSANSAETVASLPGLLFFPNIQAALAGIPEYLRSMLPTAADVQTHQVVFCKDCGTYIRKDNVWVKIDGKDAAFQRGKGGELFPPDFISAQMHRVTAMNEFVFVIDEKGRATDIWTGITAGQAIDTSALRVLEISTFNTSTYNGVPVAVVTGFSLHVNERLPSH
jgi:hypothetical protein